MPSWLPAVLSVRLSWLNCGLYVLLFICFKLSSSATAKAAALKTSKKGLQRPAARYDGIGKIGGGYGKACCKACLVGVVGLAGVAGVVGVASLVGVDLAGWSRFGWLEWLGWMGWLGWLGWLGWMGWLWWLRWLG